MPIVTVCPTKWIADRQGKISNLTLPEFPRVRAGRLFIDFDDGNVVSHRRR
jgi:hypothetical protein